MSTNSSPRVLLSAYQCGPGMGSVSQIGWEWYSRLARRTPTTLVTHVRNRPALEAAGAPIAGSEIIFIDTEWFAGPLYRLAKRIFPKSEHSVFLVSSLDFFVYDRDALKLLRKRVKRGDRWDIVHQVTPVTTAAPTRLHRLGAPTILGPLNSGLGNPPGFADVMEEESAWLYPIRNLGRWIDLLIGSSRNAAVILTATRATVESIPARYRSLCMPMLENGVDLNRFRSEPWPAFPSTNNPLKVMFVGRLVPFKGLPLLLEAIARLRGQVPIELRVIGEGPMDAEWKREAASLGLNGEAKFLGARSLDEVALEMRRSHVLCLPSIRESGGAVLLEAMASSRPVIAVAFGGPSEIVDDNVGVAVRPDGPEVVIDELADALRDILRSPERWRERGETGRRAAEGRFSWDAKIDAALAVYERVLNG
jgi:glycosyltransferase involved in cell wall biosynthesis